MRFFSTRQSISSGEISISAIIESILSIFIYLWISTKFGWYLPILASTAIAPLVLMKSEASTKTAIEWFTTATSYISSESNYDKDKNDLLRISIFPAIIASVIVVIQVVFIDYEPTFTMGFLISTASCMTSMMLYLRKHKRFPFQTMYISSISASFGMSLTHILSIITINAINSPISSNKIYLYAILSIVVLTLSSTYALIKFIIKNKNSNDSEQNPTDNLALPQLLAGATVSGAGAALSAAAISTTFVTLGPFFFGSVLFFILTLLFFFRGGALFEIGTPAGADKLIRTSSEWGVFVVPIALIIAIVIFPISIIIRISATILHLREGIYCIPENFRKLVFCTSPIHLPELVPGLSDQTQAYTITGIWDNIKDHLYYNKFATPTIYLFYIPIIILWFLPAWAYRISIKSTLFFWWPLSYLGPDRTRHNEIRQVHWRVIGSLLGKASIATSIATLSVYIFTNLQWNKLTDLPHISIVEFLFLIDIDKNIWSILAAIIAILGIFILFYVDELKSQEDGRTRKSSLLNIEFISFMIRFRFVLVVILWILTAIHLAYVINSTRCIIDINQQIRSFYELIFTKYLPKTECTKYRYIIPIISR